MKNSKMFLLSSILGLIISLLTPALFAQVSPDQENKEISDSKAIYETLELLLESMNKIQGEIKAAKKDLEEAKTQDQKMAAEKVIAQLDSRIRALQLDFEKISTGVDPGALEEESDESFDLKSEFQDLLKPLVKELSKLTEDPRKEDKLRTEIAFVKEKLSIVNKAITQTKELGSKTENHDLKKSLKQLEDRWNVKKQQFTNQLTVSEYQLRETTSGKRSFWESTQIFVESFFKNRGKNLLLSITAFICVFFGFRLLHRGIRKVSPAHKGRARSFTVCLIDVILYFLTFLLAFNAMMAVLFLSGDWVLLSFVIVFLLGVAWAGRQGIPRFWEQIKFMLNLGTVKEDERVMYNSIPWRVVSLRFYCQLENPELSTGIIKLPLSNLTDLVSRPCCEEEPWFPCKVGDWVILSDSTRGKVILQTPETVILRLPGGSLKTFVTSDFMSLTPMNISKGFRIRIAFGVDYKHQAICTSEIPEKMTEFIRNGFAAEGYDNKDLSLKVEFDSAGASSLDYMIIADFTPKSAPLYKQLERAVSRLAVDACNGYGWDIPFTSITIHNASSDEKGLAM